MTARQCGWCGRQITEYLVHDIETDHGPSAVVWCSDWRDCQAARAARPPQTTVQSRAIRH